MTREVGVLDRSTSRVRIRLLLIFTAGSILVPLETVAEDLLAPVRAAMEAAQEELGDARQRVSTGAVLEPEQAIERAELQLRLGRPSSALATVEGIETREAKAIEANALLALHEYQQAGILIRNLERRYPDRSAVLQLQYRWWTLTGNLARLQEFLEEPDSGSVTAVKRQTFKAGMQLQLLNYASALSMYRELSETELEAELRAIVLRDLGITLHRLQDYEESLAMLRESLDIAPLDHHTMTAIADTLLRLGRIREAIDVLEFTAKHYPTDMRAHQLLGAGYTETSYTELFTAFPRAFADESGRNRLDQADKALEAGRIQHARKLYLELAAQNPGWADVEVRLGSLEYAQGAFREALHHFERALMLCPSYGRAHAGYSRAAEALQLSVGIHSASDEAALAETEMPDIPDVEQFVINWSALSERHQKRLALSLGPWSRYIPPLIESGATFYVKPLFQLLSDSPHNERLRDLRIDYDSRLWDDVRGIGGHHTVVGIEDIETRIHNRYDTAIHELSHQVHDILSDEWQRRVQDLYADAMRRDGELGAAFLSQYAESSVWEYFAEGANALHNQRRDRFETREIVLERLQIIDPALLMLVREIMHEADVGPSYTAALVTTGDQALRDGTLYQAEDAYRRALLRDPENERALASQIRTKIFGDQTGEAMSLVETALALHPDSGLIAVQCADALWLSSGSTDSAIALLEGRISQIRDSERYLVDEKLAMLYLYTGETSTARRAFARVMSSQPGDPGALVGLGETEALSGNLDQAWSYYTQALQIRSGWLALRVSFAKNLILAGELKRAKEQIQVAELLRPADPEVGALRAWLLVLEGQTTSALATAIRSYESAAWNTFVAISAAVANRCTGNDADAERLFMSVDKRFNPPSIPRYVYRNAGEGTTYELGYTASAADRAMADAARKVACQYGDINAASF